jgi:hypothetical protein
MTSTRTLGIVLGIVSALMSAVALAQTAPQPVTPIAPSDTAAGGFGGAGTVLAALLGLLVIVGIGVKFYDLRKKRESEAVHLQAQVSDALLRDQSLFGLPITPTVHVPTWSGSPAIIEVAGHVPTPQARDAARRLIEAEASRLRSDFRIEDRMAIDPNMERRVA